MKSLTTHLYEAIKDPARIFIIIKPGFFKHTKEILEMFAEEGWKIERSTTKQLLLSEARTLYKIHKDEKWYQPLCEYMSSEPTTAFILRNDDLDMSPEIFKQTNAIKDRVREKYGESDMRNVMHSSDSIQHMQQERSVYFSF